MFRKAMRDLTTRKMRTVLVALSVAVGVFGVSAVCGLSSALKDSLDDKYFASNPPDIQLSTSPLAPPVLDQLRGTPNVEGLEGRLTVFSQWKPRGESTSSIQVVGVRDFATENNIGKTVLKKGAFPKPGEILFESSSLDHFDVNVGQTVTVAGAGREAQLTVSGAGDNSTYPGAPISGYATAFVNLEDAAKLAPSNNANTVFFKVRDMGDVDNTALALRARLDENNAIVNNLTVRDPDNTPGKSISTVLAGLLGAFAVIALITSSFLVVNTISTVVAEQRSQIGAMKAVGATTGMVTRIYLAVALLYGLLGTVAGLILGIIGGYLLLRFLGTFIGVDVGGLQVTPGALLVGAIVGLLVPLLAALLPVWLGTRVSIREAIMSYGLVGNFGRGLSGKIARALAFLPLTGVLASRNVLRNRMRVLLTVMGLAAAGAAAIGVYNAKEALDKGLRDAIRIYKADVLLGASDPVPAERLTSAINSVSGVQSSEAWFDTSAQTSFQTKLGKQKSSSDTVHGVPISSTAYDTAKVREGRWFEPGDRDVVVIPEQMKKNRENYNVGDTIALTIGKDTVNWRILGVSRDLLSGDTTFYAPIDQVTQVAGVPAGSTQTALVKLTDSSHANVDQKFDEINVALVNNGITGNGLIIYKLENQILNTFSVLFVLLYAVVIVVAVVGALGLFGTITMNVLERRREIGVMRSVGATTGNVLGVFLGEGLLLGVVGWLLAVVLGVLATQLFGGLITSGLLPVDVHVTPASLLLALTAILIVSFLSTLWPSISAGRTQVAEILRYS